MSADAAKKKVLIIVRDFLPYTLSVGGIIRVLKLAEFLKERDFEVHILAAEGIFVDYFGYETVVKKLKTYYVKDRLQRFLCKRASNVNKTRPSKYNGALKYIDKKFFIPDKGIFFVKNFFNRAKEIINAENIRNIIVSSPSHSSQLIGLMLKRHYGQKVNFIVDYRDSWNTTALFRKNGALASAISIFLERKVLKAADHVTCVSDSIIKKISTQIIDITSKSTVVMNGYDANMEISNYEHKKGEKLKIGYFGIINDDPNGYRDISVLFNKLDTTNVEFFFYGQTLFSQDWSLARPDIKIKGSLSHTEALEAMRTMDLLMVLHTRIDGADEVLSGKFFEYLFSQRPILAVGPSNFAAGLMVYREHFGYFLDIEKTSNFNAFFENIYKDWKHSEMPSYTKDKIKMFSRQYQFNKVLKILL